MHGYGLIFCVRWDLSTTLKTYTHTHAYRNIHWLWWNNGRNGINFHRNKKISAINFTCACGEKNETTKKNSSILPNLRLYLFIHLQIYGHFYWLFQWLFVGVCVRWIQSFWLADCLMIFHLGSRQHHERENSIFEKFNNFSARCTIVVVVFEYVCMWEWIAVICHVSQSKWSLFLIDVTSESIFFPAHFFVCVIDFCQLHCHITTFYIITD